MKIDAPNRFSKLRFGNGKEVKNRIVVPAMASETADAGGFATEGTVSRYRGLAGSGAGLVMVEYTYVHPSGRSEANQLGIQSDAHIEGLSRIAEAIREAGALAGIQLTHSGGKTSRDLTGGALMAPSRVPVPAKDREMETPDAMSSEGIGLWQEAFADAVGRAEAAGFDLVEFHAAHGYGLNQWLSPVTNRRSDDYGGTIAKNARMLLEIVDRAKRFHPGLLLAVRMPGQDFIDSGLTLRDAMWIARRLESSGIDLIDVSSGIGGWRRPRDRDGEGYLLPEAAIIQASVSIPVIGVGGIERGSFIDEAVSSRKISLAAVGRAILKGPAEWKAANLRANDEPRSGEPMRPDPMLNERTKIESVLRDYFQGYLAADSSLVAKAFHPETNLFSVDEGGLGKTTLPEWLRNLDERKARGDARTAVPETESIDITGSAAAAKVAIAFPKHRFTDYLSLLEIDGRWRIIGKVYVVRTPG